MGRTACDATLLTYNSHLFGDSILEAAASRYHSDTVRRNRIATRIQESGADIVALQEVSATSNQEWFVNRLRSEYPYSRFETGSSDLKLGSGLILLSRWPLSEIEFKEFPAFEYCAADLWNCHEYMSSKGILTATVELDPARGHKSRIGISHTSTGGDWHKGTMSSRYPHMTTPLLRAHPKTFASRRVIEGGFRLTGGFRMGS